MRPENELRPITVTRNFTQTPAGSVLWQQGQTIVLCTVSITPEVPEWFGEKRVGGWITAEYVMLPGSTSRRKPWPEIGHTDSRGTEIQRLIGRCLRAIIDLTRIGPHTLAVDCHVLQADGGTRTACISAAYVALRDAIAKLPPVIADTRNYRPAEALVDQLAAVSVGIVDGKTYLDLDYDLDKRAEVDMNVAVTGSGKFVEIQGCAENGAGFARKQMDQMLDLATEGCRKIMGIQSAALGLK